MKILGIDHGLKRVGLATGDTETKIATPFGLVKVESENQLMLELKKIIAEEDIELVVVGEPLGLAGQMTTQSQIIDNFISHLKAELNISVELSDERYSSQRADEAIASGSKKTRDELAALYMLQDYLDKKV